MHLWTFVGIAAVMVLALIAGLWATRGRKEQLRRAVLADQAALADVIALVRQKRELQAVGALMNRGNTRTLARMTVAVMRGLLKSGELE